MNKTILISLFNLIDNLESITYNFSGSSYYVNRDNVVDNYPNYSKIFNNNKLNKNNFNKYVENVMNDDDFIENNFEKMLFKS